MNTKLKPLTIADWDAMPADDGNRYEIIEGELFVSTSPGITHQNVSDNLVVLLRNFLKLNRIGGAISTPGLVLSEFSGVIPDLVYFSNESRDRVISGERLTSAPDLVIEILSKGAANTRRDRIVKRQLYAKHRVPEYWIIDCQRQAIEVYRLEGALLQPAATFEYTDELSTIALPGFSCAVSEIFEPI
jgi:Uma2 family endonuclease